MAKGLIDSLLDKIFDAEWVGWYGEHLTSRELMIVKLFGRNGKTLRNVYIPKENGDTTEIDVVFITQKGIFVIESKNYSGWIFGDEKNGFWTASLQNGIKNKFYNPIKQNQTHIRWLEKYLSDDIPMFSIIAFSERCELKKITVESPDVRVINRDDLYATIRDIWNRTEDKLDKANVQEIYEKLKPLTHVSKEVKQAHINAINEKYNKKQPDVPETADVVQEEIPEPTESPVCPRCENAQEPEELETPGIPQEAMASEETPTEPQICPRCGGTLVLRVAKRGTNAGNSFYGCSNYPKCRYIILQ